MNANRLKVGLRITRDLEGHSLVGTVLEWERLLGPNGVDLYARVEYRSLGECWIVWEPVVDLLPYYEPHHA